MIGAPEHLHYRFTRICNPGLDPILDEGIRANSASASPENHIPATPGLPRHDVKMPGIFLAHPFRANHLMPWAIETGPGNVERKVRGVVGEFDLFGSDPALVPVLAHVPGVDRCTLDNFSLDLTHENIKDPALQLLDIHGPVNNFL